eukprot:scaffold18240_cov52-Phaeocystis_antarctica.AAC.4
MAELWPPHAALAAEETQMRAMCRIVSGPPPSLQARGHAFPPPNLPASPHPRIPRIPRTPASPHLRLSASPPSRSPLSALLPHSRRPSPQLDASKGAATWSNPFRAFVASCLRKTPAQRAAVQAQRSVGAA